MPFRPAKTITWALLLALLLGVPGRGVLAGVSGCPNCSTGECQLSNESATCCDHGELESSSKVTAVRSGCTSARDCALQALSLASESLAKQDQHQSDSSPPRICRCCLGPSGPSAIVRPTIQLAESWSVDGYRLAIPGYPAADVVWELGQQRDLPLSDRSLNVVLCRWLI